MEITFYNQKEKIGKTEELYLYSLLNIDYIKLSEQERYNQIKNNLETLKMNSSDIKLQDDSIINASDIDNIEIRHHNMSKPKFFKIH
ncbi:hypothetical protein [Staphylococcus sp. 47.1]|uniref:hypothetical protein n=1 Tax=Staphylococcus sp. 47.1 TaxID=1929484 RepID=UPI0009470C8A|nr:hypothetical protein [Staphylococcus sp. 47.1]OLF32229.1 hypothetical protein BSZ11_06770 [Staphylococcus sp. 47.1]